MDKVVAVIIGLAAIIFAGFLLVSANTGSNSSNKESNDEVVSIGECSSYCSYDSPCKGACGGNCGSPSCGCRK